MSTHLVEMFSSIQGEGLYIGVRQIFIRFSGCNLKCNYCDTPFERTSDFRVELPPASGQFVSFGNPVGVSETLEVIQKLSPDKCHSISLTGGEPLLHAQFITELAETLGPTGMKFYLETNGTLPDKLLRIIDKVDIISMDIKLPGSTGCGELWDVHRQFIDIGKQKKLFVKTVITSETSHEELIKACETIGMVDDKIPLILQPVEVHKGFPEKHPSVSKMMELQELGFRYLKDVRIIPQTHKYMGLL